ncbi:MAG: hypothetical protein WCO84_01140 [bacterium]
MITIKKSIKADTRTADGVVTKEQLQQDTLSHMKDVENGCKFLAELLVSAGENHDFTKVALLDEFYDNFSTGAKEEGFKEMDWFKKHITKERHHLNDCVPKDVNLIDILEMVVDCVMAGTARRGEFYTFDVSDAVLRNALANTQKLMLDNVKVED